MFFENLVSIVHMTLSLPFNFLFSGGHKQALYLLFEKYEQRIQSIAKIKECQLLATYQGIQPNQNPRYFILVERPGIFDRISCAVDFIFIHSGECRR
jgi:hypothetical protein